MAPITDESLPYLDPEKPYPTSPEARFALDNASSHAAVGQLDMAIMVLDVAIASDNPNPYLHYNRGHYFSLLANYQSAIDDYRSCLALEPYNPTAWTCYGYALARNGQQHNAINAYSKAIDQNPSEGAHYFLRAASFLAAGDIVNTLADIDAGKQCNGIVPRRLIGEVLKSQ